MRISNAFQGESQRANDSQDEFDPWQRLDERRWGGRGLTQVDSPVIFTQPGLQSLIFTQPRQQCDFHSAQATV